MKRTTTAARDHVEAREVAATGASVARQLSDHTSESSGRIATLLLVEHLFDETVRMRVLAGQRSFDDLGSPLHSVTFCVVDLETTGGSAADCGITEIGAVRLRGGECLGTFQTLVNPGVAIPPSITFLTGITEAMVMPAPRIEEVLPSLLEFIGGSVLVGHNLRFDVSFLDAALSRGGDPRLGNTFIDTCALARRLVREEVPDCRLGTLATRFRLDHRPTHRALDDALATGDLLHVLLERAAAFGVLGLDDLVSLPKMGGHPQAPKLRLTTQLPRAPGVYVFRDRSGRPLYVGKASNLRTRVRSYFSSDDRRKIGPMLRETHGIDHVVCRSTLEAAVLESRLIATHLPRYNRQGTGRRRYVYVKLTTNEPFPRLAVVRVPRADGGLYLGPVSSTRVARLIVDAIESVVPLRRCRAPVRAGKPTRTAPCAAAQLGTAMCPCAGDVSTARYNAVVDVVHRALTREPTLLLEPLQDRMQALARSERFEEAADVRDRTAALASALFRQRRTEQLRRSGIIELDLGNGSHVELDGGRLLRAWSIGELALGVACEPPEASATSWVPVELADELACVAAWLDRNARKVRLVHCEGTLASALPAVPELSLRR
ncbi:MAG: polymerase subunit epsilon [Acidimicrobiaceae bacterium]